MDRNAARAKLKELGDARKKIETECEMLTELLTQPGFPGLAGGLVDAEGFPRADIDIPDIRAKRHRLACLRTDHAAVMTQIEAVMPVRWRWWSWLTASAGRGRCPLLARTAVCDWSLTVAPATADSVCKTRRGRSSGWMWHR